MGNGRAAPMVVSAVVERAAASAFSLVEPKAYSVADELAGYWVGD